MLSVPEFLDGKYIERNSNNLLTRCRLYVNYENFVMLFFYDGVLINLDKRTE